MVRQETTASSFSRRQMSPLRTINNGSCTKLEVTIESQGFRVSVHGESWGGNDSPGVLESLRFIPQGWQRVAGGRSIAETTGMVRNENRILKGCQKRWNDVRSGSKRSGIPAGCNCIVPNFPGVCAATPGYCLTSLRDEPQVAIQNCAIVAFPQDSR